MCICVSDVWCVRVWCVQEDASLVGSTDVRRMREGGRGGQQDEAGEGVLEGWMERREEDGGSGMELR